MYFCPPHSKVYYVEVGKEDPAAECSDISIAPATKEKILKDSRLR